MFFHSIVYMSIFGFAGGFAGWVQGEAILAVFSTEWEEFESLIYQVQLLKEDLTRAKSQKAITTRAKSLV